MSDFIYSNCEMEKDTLEKNCSIYHENLPQIDEYRGSWGTLAVSKNLYNGFQFYVDFDYLCAVISGPILFRDGNLSVYIYLDSMNREGICAKKAVDAYGALFNLFTRKKNQYFVILPEAAD